MLSTQELINKQDEKLSLIGSYISNLKSQAVVIGDTIDDHNTQLEGIAIDVENNTENLNMTSKKIDILRNKINNNMCMLMLLFIFIDVVLTVVYFQI